MPEEEGALDELREDPSSRKKFLKMAGGAGAAGALSLLLAACGKDDKKTGGAGSGAAADTQASTAKPGGDVEIVNYALTLEYLEAAFYRQVIDSGVITNAKVVSLAKRFGETEQAHVDALTQAVKSLGGTPANKPETRFQPVIDGGPTKILQTAAAVENLGAAAYLGQAGRIKDKKILAAALSIHSVEARHAAALNELIGRGFKGSLPDGAFAKPQSMAQVLKQVQPFIAS